MAAAGGFSAVYSALGFIIPVVILEIRDLSYPEVRSSSRGGEGVGVWDSKGPAPH